MILLYKNIDFKEYRVYIVLDFFIFDFDFNCDYIISCFVYWNNGLCGLFRICVYDC